MGKVLVGAAVICAAAVCAAAAAVVVHRSMRRAARWDRVKAIVKEFEEKCGTSIEKLKQVADAMNLEMHNGLVSDSGDASKLKMLITYVDNLPTGYSHFFLFLGNISVKSLYVRST
jgi:hexokinase